MNNDEKEMLIRHDEQLRALSCLPSAVNELTMQLRIANARAATVAACIGSACSVIACVGTWVILVHFSH